MKKLLMQSKTPLFFLALCCALYAFSSDMRPLCPLPAAPCLIKGAVQKGPFIQGSDVVIQQLDAGLKPAGSVYHLQTQDDFGTFTIESAVSATYVEVIAKGYYYNEVSGALSASPITLRALADVTAGRTINVNVLTTLARERTAFLYSQTGNFSDAKIQAENEVLELFFIHDPHEPFEQMSMVGGGESAAMLLAVSAIVQGNNTVGQLSELLAKIAGDIKTGGALTQPFLIDHLRSNAMALNMPDIRQKMAGRLALLGSSAAIPVFEDYIDSNGNGAIDKDETAPPVFSVPSGIYSHDIAVELSCATDNATIYYTTDGSEPSAQSIPYQGAITVSADTTVRAIAVMDGMLQSAVAEAVYIIQTGLNRVAAPVFSIPGGYYDTAQQVTITCATPGATIYWTIDGIYPSTASSTYYAPVTVLNKYLQAIAVKEGMEPSAISRIYVRQPGFPEIISLEPDESMGAVGQPADFTLTIGDDDGFDNISGVRMSLRAEGHGTTSLTSDAICFLYRNGSATFSLFDYARSGFVSAAFGSATVLETNNCIVDARYCSVVRSGSTITLHFRLIPKAAFIADMPDKRMWCWTYDKNDHNIVSQIGWYYIPE